MAAARYADNTTAILAGAPGYNLPLAALANIFGAQRYATVATGNPATPAGLETAFTTAERKTVAAAVLARCDALDGASDGLVQDTRTCQRSVRPEARRAHLRRRARRQLPVAGAEDRHRADLQRRHHEQRQSFYAAFPFDSGIGGGGIPFWEFTAPLVLDSGAVGVIFKVPPVRRRVDQRAGFQSGAEHRPALAELYATNATYTEAAMSFMTPPDAQDMNARAQPRCQDPRLPRRQRSDLLDRRHHTWYRGIDRSSGSRADEFARLYPVPGMGHCSGGPAADQADFITPLVQWVEHGREPDAIIATARGPGNAGGVNAEVPADWAADRTRPLCPYPSVARYVHGNIEKASSFICLPGLP